MAIMMSVSTSGCTPTSTCGKQAGNTHRCRPCVEAYAGDTLKCCVSLKPEITLNTCGTHRSGIYTQTFGDLKPIREGLLCIILLAEVCTCGSLACGTTWNSQSKQRQDKSVRAVHIRQETGPSQNIQNRIIVLGAGGHSRQNCGAPSREIPCQEIVRVSRITVKACICVQRAATASLRTPH